MDGLQTSDCRHNALWILFGFCWNGSLFHLPLPADVASMTLVPLAQNTCLEDTQSATARRRWLMAESYWLTAGNG